MLLCTLACVMLVVHNDTTKEFARNNMWPFFLALVAVLVTIISLSCCEGVRRTAPTNMIFLAIFTIGESVMVGYSTTQYEPEVVMVTSSLRINCSPSLFLFKRKIVENQNFVNLQVMLAVGVTAVVVIALTVFAFQVFLIIFILYISKRFCFEKFSRKQSQYSSFDIYFDGL